ncbi:hypothetical protein [Planctomonas deserti]|uniref:hypothetical protein n=1 Tax=Planctomonas deserti TaxID=2144185 RepID=UPI000D3503E7|nr:hypothetical protein [Planctomonas deserti]
MLQALDAAAESDEPLTIAAVARRAGVSREFIHSRPVLHAKVQEVAALREDARSRVALDQATVQEGRVADRSTLATKVIRQRDEIRRLADRVSELETARSKLLGEKLLALDSTAQVDIQEALSRSDRLQAENLDLKRRLNEAQRVRAELEDALAAVRVALAEALSDQRLNVTPLTPQRQRLPGAPPPPAP